MALIGVDDPSGQGAEALNRFPDGSFPAPTPTPTTAWPASDDSSRSTRPSVSGPSESSLPVRSRRFPSTIRRCTRSMPNVSSWAFPSSAAQAFLVRASGACQHVELIDEVMFDFPDLVFVTRHGCEPWTDLAVKLMLKWPGLHYSTSAFAPRYYPRPSSTMPTPVGPTRSSTPATSRWASP